MRCERCQTDVETGSLGAVYLRMDGTSASAVRRLCEPCADLLWRFLHDPVRHVQTTDPVTPWGNAHIMTCPSCADRLGSAAEPRRMRHRAAQ